MNVDRIWVCAFAKGYYCGRAIGDGINPFEFGRPERTAWWEGYDFGVSDHYRYDVDKLEEQA
jgi:hypothetical protein